jgi:hypothetical protein
VVRPGLPAMCLSAWARRVACSLPASEVLPEWFQCAKRANGLAASPESTGLLGARSVQASCRLRRMGWRSQPAESNPGPPARRRSDQPPVSVGRKWQQAWQVVGFAEQLAAADPAGVRKVGACLARQNAREWVRCCPSRRAASRQEHGTGSSRPLCGKRAVRRCRKTREYWLYDRTG